MQCFSSMSAIFTTSSLNLVRVNNLVDSITASFFDKYAMRAGADSNMLESGGGNLSDERMRLESPRCPFERSYIICNSPSDNGSTASPQLVCSSPFFLDKVRSASKCDWSMDVTCGVEATPEISFGKRNRSDSDETGERPLKKSKSIHSFSMGHSSYGSPLRLEVRKQRSFEKFLGSTESDVSYKSFRNETAKSRRNSGRNLFRGVVHRTRPSPRFVKKMRSPESCRCGTPRNRQGSRKTRSRTSRLLELCRWLTMKGYRSIAGYTTVEAGTREESETVTEDVNRLCRACSELTTQHSRLRCEQDRLKEEMTKMKHDHDNLQCVVNSALKENASLHEEVNRLRKENDALRDSLSAAEERINEIARNVQNESETTQALLKKIEERLQSVEGGMSNRCRPMNADPPPPPPPPPPPQPAIAITRLQNGVQKKTAQPTDKKEARLTITPQDIASVKLRKAKDNHTETRKPIQRGAPLVTQDMLRNCRASLQRRQCSTAALEDTTISEFEKCLLQDSSLNHLNRRRISAFRSSENLSVINQAGGRSPRSANQSPRSPRTQRSRSLHPTPGKTTTLSLLATRS